MAPKVVLIGPMGAGKTSVGKNLAEKLGIDFADTDRLIEIDQGKSVSEIFIEDGEAHFRLVEESIVIDALNEQDGVLSLGGGAITSIPVQEKLGTSGAIKAFLDISLTAVAPRVGFDSARPLLMVNPRQKWLELMNARRESYEKLADIQIDVSDLSVEDVASRIILEARLNK
ncbi:MAG: shikimate kinase [Candidatus Nanopelagicaceae bacterium]|jgi:shikimate kinase